MIAIFERDSADSISRLFSFAWIDAVLRAAPLAHSVVDAFRFVSTLDGDFAPVDSEADGFAVTRATGALLSPHNAATRALLPDSPYFALMGARELPQAFPWLSAALHSLLSG
jgi:hypothetical protein